MNILAIAHEKELNGASLSLMSVLLYLQKENNVFLFVPFQDGNIIKVARENNITVVNHPYHKWMIQTRTKRSFVKNKFLWHLKYSKDNDLIAKKISQYIFDNNIDVIYSNTRVIDLGVRLKKLTGKKHVWHIREFGEEDFNYRILNSYTKHWSNISNYTDVIIANSKAVTKKITDIIGLKVPVKTIYNGVDEIHICNKELPNEYKFIKFLISGRICKAKGHDLLIKAIQILLDNNIENFEVFVAGRGDIKALCGKEFNKEVERKCKLLGQVDKIWELRKNMDVELMCSRQEAFGRVTVEAMFSKLLVIGSNSGGTAELIIDMQNGILFNPGDAYDLARQMMRVIKNPGLIRKIVPKAQKDAIDRYSASKYCEAVSKVILSL